MPVRILIAIVVILVLGAGAYYLLRPYFEPPPPPPAPPRVAAPAPKSTQPKFPIEAPPKPLPSLAQSDPAMQEAFSGLFDAKTIERFFNLESVVRRIVATVDNLPRETVAARLNPIKPLGGLFVTAGKDATLAIGPKNAARYQPMVRVFEAVDTEKLITAYRHFYPLFQQSYVELGYPNGYFNDRLVEVIDHLLEAPDPKGPITLVSPKVLYEYADPELESLSAGRKIMVRMGAENAARVKAKLRDLRRAVTPQGSVAAKPQ